MLLRGLILGLAMLQLGAMLANTARADEEIEARREKRQREQMESLLQSLIQAKAKPEGEREYCDASSCPTRCAEIEYYLRTTLKMKALVNEVALIVESHDAKLVPTRVYRVKYEDLKGKAYEHDFIMQQHGADWRVKAHVACVELPKPAPPETAPPATTGDLPFVP